MNARRVMAVGPVQAGKSTLISALFRPDFAVTKTQSLDFSIRAIDTPGEYVENPLYHRALFATALESELILFVQDGTEDAFHFPPGFSSGFPRPAIGVVTKMDMEESNFSLAKSILIRIGIREEEIFSVSAKTGAGIEELRAYIENRLDMLL